MITISRTFSVTVPLIALLVGACDRTSPSEVERTARAPEAAMTETSPVANGDVAGVTAVVTAWDAAWNAGDGNGIGALFVDDAEFINGRGQIALGSATIRAQHVASLGGVFKGSHTQGTIRNIVFLTGTSAVVNVYNELTNFKALPPGVVPTKPGLQSGLHKRLVIKRGGSWRIVQMQITSIAPPAT